MVRLLSLSIATACIVREMIPQIKVHDSHALLTGIQQ